MNIKNSANFTTYFGDIAIMKENYKENYEVMKKISLYVNDFTDKIGLVGNSLADLSNPKTATNSSSSSSASKDTTSSNISTDITNKWKLLKESCLNPAPIFQYAEDDLRNNLSKLITDIAEKYKEKMKMLIKKCKEQIESIDVAQKAAKASHDAYVQCGKVVQDAYNANPQSTKLPQLRDEFVKSRNNAVEFHKKYNEERTAFSDNFESILTDFEQIEQWRIEHIKLAFLSLSENVGRTASHLKTSASKMASLASQIQPDCDSKLFNDLHALKDCQCSPLYEMIPVSARATNHLDMKTVFAKELAEGGRLGITKQDFQGGPNQLDVVGNEHLVVLREEGDQLVCKNINECVGLVPASVIDLIE